MPNLISHLLSFIRTINLDGFGRKMWRNPGVDTTDFFNYGLDEKQWNNYCKEMASIILLTSLVCKKLGKTDLFICLLLVVFLSLARAYT